MRVLYHLWLSPFCRKVRIVLMEKRLEFELKAENVWDRRQEFLALNPAGDVPVLAHTWYSIELEARTAVPEWGGQLVKSSQEEDAAVGADGVARWVLRRQTEFRVVR